MLLKINGVPLPSPSKYSVDISDLDSSSTGRNSEGVMIRDRVRKDIYRIDASWEALASTDYITVVNALSPVEFMVEFFDPNTNAFKSAKMYAGNRKAELIRYSGQKSRWNLSCALIQC